MHVGKLERDDGKTAVAAFDDGEIRTLEGDELLNARISDSTAADLRARGLHPKEEGLGGVSEKGIFEMAKKPTSKLKPGDCRGKCIVLTGIGVQQLPGTSRARGRLGVITGSNGLTKNSLSYTAHFSTGPKERVA